ncbi:G0/G1 switch protein 2-like [Thomomys bottae]
METVQELLPLAKEMLAQKPGGRLVRLYVLGSVLALVGVVLGLVETVCGSFAAARRARDAPCALRPPRAPLGRARKQQPGAQPCSRADRQHAS